MMGLSGKEKRQPYMGCAPPLPLVLLGLGKVAGPLSLFPPSANPIPTRIGGGDPTPRGSRTLLARHTLAGQPPPSGPNCTRRGAAPPFPSPSPPSFPLLVGVGKEESYSY